MIDCLLVSDTVSIGKFVVDTGAKYTCCNYCVIDSILMEDQFSKSETKLIELYFCRDAEDFDCNFQLR